MIDVVNAEMVRALRVVSVEQGLDPRDFALVAFGGAGPLHACALAEELEIETVLVPAAAGVLSALGLVAARAPRPRPLVRHVACGARASSRPRARPTCATRPVVRADGSARARLEQRFHAAHAARYGYADRARPIELVAVRTAEVRPAPPVEVTGPPLDVTGPEVLELEGASGLGRARLGGEDGPYGTLVLRRAA